MGKPRQFFVWVKPSSPSSIPGDVLMMIKALTQEIRSKFLKDHDDEKAGGKGGGKKRHKSSNASAESSEDLIFVSVADVEEEGLILKRGTKVKFRLYTDTKGVGGCEVESA